MHWKKRHMRRPQANMPGHAHELTFSCYHSYPFLRAERTCDWLAASAGWSDEKNLLRPDAIDFGGLTGMFGGEG